MIDPKHAHLPERELTKLYGPLYPDLGAKVAKLRKGKDRQAHGQAVLAAFQARHRALLNRDATPDSRPHCASGTGHTDGKSILAAIRARHAAALHSPKGNIWPCRDPKHGISIQDAYKAAMEAKRAAYEAVGATTREEYERAAPVTLPPRQEDELSAQERARLAELEERQAKAEDIMRRLMRDNQALIDNGKALIAEGDRLEERIRFLEKDNKAHVAKVCELYDQIEELEENLDEVEADLIAERAKVLAVTSRLPAEYRA